MSTVTRNHALDAARAFALLLGIVLHASMGFFLPIPAQDPSSSTTLAVSFYVIHMFRMALFFLIAGFFARMAFHRLGGRAFLKDRARRIVVPMTVGWVVLAPVTIAIVIWGLSRTLPDAAAAGDAAAPPNGLPLVHLWFLYYLCIFYVLALAVRALITSFGRGDRLRAGADGAFRWLLHSGLAPVVLALPLFGVLYADQAWAVWFGIPTPDHGLLPNLPAMVAYGGAFLAGWMLHRQTALLETIARQWGLNLLLALGLTVVCLVLVGPRPDIMAATALEGGGGVRLAYAAAYAIGVWCWVFALVGLVTRFCANESPVRRYLADASYWMYLVHLPIVFGLQVLLLDWAVHWAVKFPVIIALTLALTIASYQLLVRGTAIGAVLNGKRMPQVRDTSTSVTPISSSLPLAELVAVSKNYGQTVALDGLGLTLKPGELLALLGPNGAGKTTAIDIWLGLLEPDKGRAGLMGYPAHDVRGRLGIGVMMQDVNLNPALTAREHIKLTSSYYRDPLDVDATIELAGIAANADRRYGRLSTGQKRQVQFALAVCGKPRLLFLDEPSVGLDVTARTALWAAVRKLVADGCAILLTTHYLEEAEALADRVAVITAGSLQVEGTVDEIRDRIERRRISCVCQLDAEEVRHWPGVIEVEREDTLLHITATNAEDVVARLLGQAPDLTRLEVKQASLADAFTQLTQEAA